MFRSPKSREKKNFIEAKVFSEDKVYTISNAIFVQFDFNKLGLTPEYRVILRFHEIRKEGHNFKEAIELLKKEYLYS